MKDKMIWKINKKMIMIRINNHVAQLIIQMNSAWPTNNKKILEILHIYQVVLLRKLFLQAKSLSNRKAYSM